MRPDTQETKDTMAGRTYHSAVFLLVVWLCLLPRAATHACNPGPTIDPFQTDGDPPPDDQGNSEGAKSADPVTLRTGAYTLEVQDVVLPGRAMGIDLRRTYRSDAMSDGVYEFNSGCAVPTNGGNLLLFKWLLPAGAHVVEAPPPWPGSGPFGWPVWCRPPSTGGSESSWIKCAFDREGVYVLRLRCDEYELNWHQCHLGFCPICGGWCYSAPCCMGPYFRGSSEADVRVEVYSSPRSQRYGHGWDMSLNQKVRVFSEDTIVYYDGAHKKLVYRKDATGKYRNSTCQDYIEKLSPPYIALCKKDGTRYYFDEYGNLSTIRDRHSNGVFFHYEGGEFDRRLTRVWNDLGRYITLSYDSSGRMSQVEDDTGRRWHYYYDAHGQLTQVTTPGTSEYPDGLTTAYTYDPTSHGLLTVSDPANQTYISNTYTNGRVTSQRYGQSDQGFTLAYYGPGCAQVTDREGYTTSTYYNAAGNPTQEIVPTAGLRPDDPASYVTQYAYDAQNRLTSVSYPGGGRIQYTYDNQGNMLTATAVPNDASGNLTVTYEYEPWHNFVKRITDPRGKTTVFTYDYEIPGGTYVGNLMKITYPQVPTSHNPLVMATPEVFFTYNTYGQVRTITSPDGLVVEYQYYDDPINDGANYGRLKKKIADAGADPGCLNAVTTYTYDALGRVHTITDDLGNTATLTFNEIDLLTLVQSPANYLTKMHYDANKKLTKVEQQFGNDWRTIEMAYNVLDKLVSITDPLGRVTSLEYNKNDRVKKATDAEQNSTTSTYDERGLLWKVTDALARVSEYSYHPDGQIKKVKDAKGQVTDCHYDGHGRLDTITYPPNANGVRTTEQASYDENSNMTSVTSRSGQTIQCTYDAFNRLETVTRPGESPIVADYDVGGRLTRLAQGGAAVTASYERGWLDTITSADGRTVGYEHDRLGRLSKLIYPDGSYVTYHYDNESRLTDIKDDSTPAVLLAHYVYDELSRPVAVSRANGVATSYDYQDKAPAEDDNLGAELAGVSHSFNGGNITLEYGYDQVDNCRSGKVNGADRHDYEYDDCYQMLHSTFYGAGGYTEVYDYDALGSRQSLTRDGAPTYYSTAGNQLNQYGTVGAAAYTYDANGNLVSNGSFTFGYDCENRLLSASRSGTSVSYYYNAIKAQVTLSGPPIRTSG